MPLDPGAITAGFNVGQQAAGGGQFSGLNDSLKNMVNFLIQHKQEQEKMAMESQMKMRDALIASGKVTPNAQGIAGAGFPPGWNPTPPFQMPTGAIPKGVSVDEKGNPTSSYEFSTPESQATLAEKNASLAKTQEETLRAKAGAKAGMSTEEAIKNTLPHRGWNPMTWMTPDPTQDKINSQRARLAGGGQTDSHPLLDKVQAARDAGYTDKEIADYLHNKVTS